MKTLSSKIFLKFLVNQDICWQLQFNSWIYMFPLTFFFNGFSFFFFFNFVTLAAYVS